MPHLYLHLENHIGLQRDLEGHNYKTIDAAISEAGRTAGSVLAEDIAAGRTPVSIRVMIEDADGARIATLQSSTSIDRT
jgi:hypothetical protein